jgi:hypothetical protein
VGAEVRAWGLDTGSPGSTTEGGPRFRLTTSNVAIMPSSSWSSMWQWIMNFPVKSVNLAATSTVSPGSSFQVSS